VLFRQLGMLSRDAWDEEGRLACRLDGCSAPPIGQARLQGGGVHLQGVSGNAHWEVAWGFFRRQTMWRGYVRSQLTSALAAGTNRVSSGCWRSVLSIGIKSSWRLVRASRTQCTWIVVSCRAQSRQFRLSESSQQKGWLTEGE